MKILNTQSKTITGAAIIISIAALTSRFVGLLRDRILAHYFGAGAVMDSYYAAFKIPDLIYNLLVAGALTAGFIPIFTKLFHKTENKNPAWKLASNTLNAIGIILIVICGLGIIATPQIVPLIAPGFTGTRLELVKTFTRIMFLSPLLLGLSMVVGGILQSLRQFILYSIAPIFYNVGIIIGVVFFTPIMGLSGLAWGVVLGAAMHFLIQLYGAWQAGFRWQWILDWKDKEMIMIGKLMVPRTIGLAVNNLNNIIFTIFASFLAIGSVATYNFAYNLQWFPIGIIGVPFAIAVFPVLSEAMARHDKKEFISNLSATLRQILFFIIPLSIIFLMLRAQIVRTALGTGAFDWNATINTADALAFFSLGMISQSLIQLLARAFYAMSNTKTPLFIGLISEATTTLFAFLLMKPLGVAGLALASSLGATINMIILIVALRRKLGSLEGYKIFDSLYKISIASLFMAIVIQFLKTPLSKIMDLQHFWGIFLQGLVAGLSGLFIYAILCYLLNVSKLEQFKGSFKKRWLKFKNLPLEEGTDVVD